MEDISHSRLHFATDGQMQNCRTGRSCDVCALEPTFSEQTNERTNERTYVRTYVQQSFTKEEMVIVAILTFAYCTWPIVVIPIRLSGWRRNTTTIIDWKLWEDAIFGQSNQDKENDPKMWFSKISFWLTFGYGMIDEQLSSGDLFDDARSTAESNRIWLVSERRKNNTGNGD